MIIKFDTSSTTARDLGGFVALLLTCGNLTRDALAHVMAPYGVTQQARINVSNGDDSFDARAGSLLGLAAMAHTDEIVKLIGLLNAELYSRRIPAADNPATGADAAALNSDAHGELAQTGGGASLNSTLLGSDLSKIFGGEAARALDTGMTNFTAKDMPKNEPPMLDLTGVFGAKPLSDTEIAETFKQIDEKSVSIGYRDPAAPALDKAGIPWDSRIHSASKSINQTDGLWRQKRGVSPELVATVVGQLKQAQSVPGVGTHGSAELDADAAKLTAMGGDAGPTIEDLGGVTGQLVKIPPPPPVAAAPIAPPPPPADTGEIDSLPRLLKFITEQKLAGKLNQTQVNQALIAVGIEGPLPVLQARPDLIPTVAGKLRALAGV